MRYLVPVLPLWPTHLLHMQVRNRWRPIQNPFLPCRSKKFIPVPLWSYESRMVKHPPLGFVRSRYKSSHVLRSVLEQIFSSSKSKLNGKYQSVPKLKQDEESLESLSLEEHNSNLG